MKPAYTTNLYNDLPFYIRLLLLFARTHVSVDFETESISGKPSGMTAMVCKVLFGVTYVIEIRDIPSPKQLVPSHVNKRIKW